MEVVEGKKGMEEGCQVAEWCPPRDEQGVDGTGSWGAGYLNADDGRGTAGHRAPVTGCHSEDILGTVRPA